MHDCMIIRYLSNLFMVIPSSIASFMILCPFRAFPSESGGAACASRGAASAPKAWLWWRSAAMVASTMGRPSDLMAYGFLQKWHFLFMGR